MLITANRPISASLPILIQIDERHNFDPGKYFSDHSSRYSIMDSVSKNILKNTQSVSFVPSMKISQISTEPLVSDREMIKKYIEKELLFLTPLSICHMAAYLTERQPQGEDGYLPTDGKKTILGYLDHENSITIFWCHIFKKWIFEWHESGEWNQEVDLLIKKKTIFDN